MKHTTRQLLLASLAMVAPWPALAGDITAPSRIDSVTVYPDGASVTRLVKVALPAGATALLVRGLGPTVDPASVRVEGEAAAALTIGSVELRTVAADPDAAISPDLERQLKTLRREREDVAVRIRALQTKQQAIEAYARPAGDKDKPAGPLPVERWSEAWDRIGDALAATGAALAEAGRTAAELDARIAALEQARPKPPRPGAPLRDLVIALDAAAATSGELRISYRVGGAGWQPAYDARLDTAAGAPALTLTRRARIVQRTGEDWSEVALAVSTLRVSRGSAAPEPQPLLVGLRDSAVPTESMPRPAPMAGVIAPAAPEPRDQAFEVARSKAVPVAEQLADFDGAGLQATFRVPGTVSVAADGSARTVALASQRLNPRLSVRAVPALDETAYLEASFVNEEEAPLLAGEVSLTRDGSFVGRSRLRQVAPGERVELGFGADDRVKITRAVVKKRESDGGWIDSARTDQREFRMTVRNLHPGALRIAIFESLPVSEQAAVTVETLPATTPPTEKAVADKRGVVAWTYDYQPGETREIRVAYRLKWHGDRTLVFRPQRGAAGL
jgi:uncharacterized protein (TIGR02231 family)